MPTISLPYIFALLAVVFLLPLPALALDPPSFSTTNGIAVSNGSFANEVPITMTGPGGADIHFTTDGSDPTTASPQYSTAITISSPTQLKAVAWQSGTYSTVTTAYLDVDPDFAIMESGIVFFTIGGTVNVGDILTITIFDADIVAASPKPAGSRVITYTVVSGDTLSSIAHSLSTGINTDSAISNARISSDWLTGTDYIRVKRNWAGITTFTQSVSPTGNETITQQSGLGLRLRSTFGVVAGSSVSAPVSKWVDLSGSGNDATGTSGSEPTTTTTMGVDAIKFNGTSQYFSLPSGFANFKRGGTFLLVVKPDTLATGKRLFDLGNGTASNNLYMSETSSSSHDLHVFNASSDNAVSSSIAISAGHFQLLEGVYVYNEQFNNYSGAVYKNGISGGTGSMATTGNVTRANNFIGQASGGGSYFSGSICEILFYFNTIDSQQRASIEAYFIRKYGLLALTPPAPKISVPTGTLNGPTQVSIFSEPGTAIRFTTDNSIPTLTSPAYCAPLTVNYTTHLKAIAVKNGVVSGTTCGSGGVACADYTLDSSIWPEPNPSDTSAPTINLHLPVESQ